MTVLLQVSDPHFGTERPAVVEALVELARRQTPDVLVLSGDVTQRARAAQFRAAAACIARLGIADQLVVPGNHDIPLYNLAARLLAPYRKHRATFGADLEPVFESAELLIVGVNTTRPWRHEDGQISARQVDRVARRLQAAAAGQLRVVVTHQPIAVLRDEDRPNLLHGRDRAIRAWARAGADLILGGHIHLPFTVPLHDQQPGLGRPVWAVQAGTALSTRVRHEANNSVNLIRHAGLVDGARRVTVERWDYAEAASRFDRVAAQSMAFDAG